MTQYRDPKESRAQIKAFAHKVLRRVHSLGARTQTLDDVEGELWVAWCLACERFNPEAGCAFSTYLYTGMRRHINRWIEKNFERFHDETVAASLDASYGSEMSEDGSGSTLGEAVADTHMRQDQEYEQKDCFAYALTRLSDRAKMFLTFLKDHPPELMAQMKDLEAKAKHAKELGVTYAMPNRLTSFMIFDFMGATRVERKQIMDEVAQVGQLISNQG
jgi:DNA-directed RNA polymerase specialized sigma subunit